MASCFQHINECLYVVKSQLRSHWAYQLIHSLRENTLCHTELARAQPMSIILKLFKLAVRVVQYKDRIKLHLPSTCAVKGLLHRVTELLFLAYPPLTT